VFTVCLISRFLGRSCMVKFQDKHKYSISSPRRELISKKEKKTGSIICVLLRMYNTYAYVYILIYYCICIITTPSLSKTQKCITPQINAKSWERPRLWYINSINNKIDYWSPIVILKTYHYLKTSKTYFKSLKHIGQYFDFRLCMKIFILYTALQCDTEIPTIIIYNNLNIRYY